MKAGGGQTDYNLDIPKQRCNNIGSVNFVLMITGLIFPFD